MKSLSTTARFDYGASRHRRSKCRRSNNGPQSGQRLMRMLWHRIRTANILLVRIKALANEVAKNLVLAGIGSLTIVDHELVTEDDLCSQFLLSEADIGTNVSK